MLSKDTSHNHTTVARLMAAAHPAAFCCLAHCQANKRALWHACWQKQLTAANYYT